MELHVERELLAGAHARAASLAAGGEAIGRQTLDLERDRSPAGDRARPGEDFHDLTRMRGNCGFGCPCHRRNPGGSEGVGHRHLGRFDLILKDDSMYFYRPTT